MEIQSERLILREYVKEDWETVHLYGSIPEFSQYEMWGPNTEEDTKNFIADAMIKASISPRFEYELAVCLKEKNLQIGGCGIRRDSESSYVANLGWAIHPQFQNKGFATEAAAALIQVGFQQLNLAVIYATCDTRNIASFKVMEKLGMQRVGKLQGNRRIEGKILDSYRYEILPKSE
ncbi:MAG: GNAT family N-acetyltransferase [Bdellovibrionales bacterium]|nr:GNAT family N-acetyltransferase [Bdellovibrionales bacterium]